MNKWPGTTPLVSYGDNFNIEYNKSTVNARQNLGLAQYRPHSMSEIFPNTPAKEVPSDAISKTLRAYNIPSIPYLVINDHLFESRALEVPVARDIQFGSRLAFQGDHLCWASHDTINYILDSGKTQSFAKRVAVGSPILQIETLSREVMLMRTRLGLGTLHANEVSYLVPGNTVHMALRDQRAAVSFDTGVVKLVDLTSGSTTLEHAFPKSTIGGFSRMDWGSKNQLFHVNHNQVSLLDIRSGKPHQLRNSYSDHLTAVRDIVSTGNNVFVLESTSILWYDARQPSKPVLEQQHFMKRNETSWSLDLLASDDSSTQLLLSSPVTSFNTVFNFGTDHNFPVSRQDPYLIELWPTIMVDSQIAKPSDTGYNLYISTPSEGLFKQQIAHGEPPSSPSPPADGPMYEEAPERETPNFELSEVPPNSWRRNVPRFKTVFEKPRKPEMDSKGITPIFSALGFRDEVEFAEYNHAIWLEGVDPKTREVRSKYVNDILTDMSAIKIHETSFKEPENVHDNIWAAVKNWPDPLQTGEEKQSFKAEPQSSVDQPPSSLPDPFGFTQPEMRLPMSQALHIPSSQPVEGGFSFSQPVSRAVPGKKKRKRPPRNRDGFA